MEKEEAIQVREKADTGRQRKKPPVTKRRYSPCEPSPPPSKKTKKDREHFDIYKKKHNLKFRVRSSKRTVLYNTTHPD
ncbi:hypothetical protein PC113_g5195 [Phytophthora cactorum]|uniref:Uncharacterized protein n=1 Tax=Phytophthora cactorum TaxID=29920 RepID=A0A8T0ZKX2_9STRA|nr:hypothetical protein PC113_g5195 [Phytophthora cactorum]KAG3183654.1 hypothetical protein C6341_g5403 [Phytophthora cactorum]